MESEYRGSDRPIASASFDWWSWNRDFGPHPELVQQVVAFFLGDTPVTKPVDLEATVTGRKTPSSEFWMLADQKRVALRGPRTFTRETHKRDHKLLYFRSSSFICSAMTACKR
jgi:hypothetical protein